MKADNPFDRKLEAQKAVLSETVRERLVFVTDTMDLCWAAAQAVFDEQARPEHAIAIYTLAALPLPSST